jgi:hypothetical protein
MGLFSKMTGGADKKLLETGLFGRGIITGVRPTGTTIQTGHGGPQRVCLFTVEVSLDNRAPYLATCKQRFPEFEIARIQPGNTTFAVWADPADPTHITLDFNTEPPVVTSGNGPSAAAILATGSPGQAVIVASQPLGKRSRAGVDMYFFRLTVIPEGQQPYQIRVGNPTPPAALPFLFPGSKVPVKIGAGPNDVVIDWDAAMAAAQG